MNLSQYAEHRKQSKSVVAAALKSGRIPGRLVRGRGKTKVWEIDPTEADAAWAQNTDIDRASRTDLRRILKAESAGASKPNRASASKLDLPEGQEDGGDLPEDPSMLLSPSERKTVMTASGSLARIVAGRPSIEQAGVLIEVQELFLNSVACALDEVNGYQE